MAIRSKTEIMDVIKSYLGEDLTDEAITFLEDLSDTVDDYERRLADVTDWEGKYNELDESWRKRYKERFFEGGTDEDGSFIEDVNDLEEQDEAPATFEELFEEVDVVKEGEK